MPYVIGDVYFTAMDDPTLLEYFRSREYGMHARERTLLGLRRQLGIEDSEE